jgi:glycosyltransferase involved in cell wall biosynthesis
LVVANEIRRPKISVTVPTYNRAETFRRTLAYLSDQELDRADYEVVIVDDGSSDATRAVVTQWIACAPCRVQYIYQSNHGPGYSYNRAFEAAQAPIVLLIADDIFLPPQALKEHVEMHRLHPQEEVAVFGRTEISPELNKSVFLRKFDRNRCSDYAGCQELPYYMFFGCNISAKREFVLRYGGMPEEIGIGGAIAHQDRVLGHRLMKGGLRILYCPEALAYHHHDITLQQMCKFQYRQGESFNQTRIWINEPELAVAAHFWDISTVWDHLRVWFGPRRNLVAPADRNPLLLLGRYFLRSLAFNAVTVNLLWTPLANRAEFSPVIAGLVHPRIYRGIVAYHTFRGYRKGRTWKRAPAPQPTQA